MGEIIPFSNIKKEDLRRRCMYRVRKIQIKGEDKKFKLYPIIALYTKNSNIPIFYTGYERYIHDYVEREFLDDKTLSTKAYAVCHFLNFLLWETKINFLHECTEENIGNFFLRIKTKKNGTEYKKDTWYRYRDYVIEFLVLYYKYNKDILKFNYKGENLRTEVIIKDEKNGKKNILVKNNGLSVKSPKTTTKKNRILVYEYLKLLLFEAIKYDPEIALGIALGAFAGLREGEVVNLTYGRIIIEQNGFKVDQVIKIDLTNKAPHFQNWTKKTDPGSIKKYRVQMVFHDFCSTVKKLFEYHVMLMESKGYDTSENAPLFVNKRGNPMTVQTYSNRVKKLFEKRFINALIKECEEQGKYAENAAFIESYKKEYPGAHMLRHWFTMYLVTKTSLKPGEIMRWRGDSSQESMGEYIQEGKVLQELFLASSYSFQNRILGDIIL